MQITIVNVLAHKNSNRRKNQEKEWDKWNFIIDSEEKLISLGMKNEKFILRKTVEFLKRNLPVTFFHTVSKQFD
jgi:hypothetical protein